MRAIGIHEDWTATPPGRTPTQVLARYPLSGIGRAFTGSPLTTVQNLRNKVLAKIQPYLNAGTKNIYVSVKTDITQTRNGDWDARYQELGVYIAQLELQYGVKIIVIPWHEPEDNFSSGAAFVSYYNKVYTAIKTGASTVKVRPCFLSYQWAPNSSGTASIGGKTNSPADWFNGLKMANGVCVDVYNGRSFPLDQILTEHPGFARWVQYLPSTVRINLTERGWETPSSSNSTNRSALRATTMRREFDWLMSSDPIAQRVDDYTIWSSPGTENAAGLIMDSAAEAEIDRLFSLAFPLIPPDPEDPPAPGPTDPPVPPVVTDPDETDVQYRLGHAAGLATGLKAGLDAGLAASFRRDSGRIRVR